MKRYIYLKLFPYYAPLYRAPVAVTTADSDTVDKMIRELETYLETTIDASWKGYTCEFKKLRDRDEQVGQWMVDWLCAEGWEPFAAHAFAQDKRLGGEALQLEVLHFRKEVEEDRQD